MTQINIKVSGAAARAEKKGLITSGMVGLPVTFTFDDSWGGLVATAVFSGSGVTKSVPLLGATETVVPWEVMAEPHTILRIGTEGRLTDGTLVIPTTWATVGTIIPGANATDDLATPPTPTPFDRIISLIGNLDDLTTEAHESLVAAINEAMAKGGEVDQEAVREIVEDYLAANPPKVTETDPTVPAWAKQPKKPAYTADEVGALSAETLPEAITTALAQAKASGAFDGADGITPHIGDNGNWYLGNTDTGIKAAGSDGTTPDIKIGTVETLPAGSAATASMEGTEKNPLLNLGIPQGADGKTAYQYAVEGGYTGTEAEFAAKLAEEIPSDDHINGLIDTKLGVIENGAY